MKHCLWLAVCLLCISSYGDSVAEFRLDELLWTGAEGEVIETQNGINGTASMNTTTEPQGLVCAAGDFSANSIHDMVFLDAGILNNKTEFSISVWVKTSNKSSQLIVSGANSSQANELLMWFPTSTTFAPILKGSSLQGVAIPDISDNDWHHLVWSRSNLDSCIYVDGAVIGCVSRNSEVVSIDPGGLILAQEQDKVGGSFDINQDFEGLIDELVIFDSALDAAEVETINKNNIAGLGWKGNVRNCIELAASWQFEEKAWDGTSGEVRDTSANSINGTSFNGPENTDKNPVFSAQPGTCRYGDFDGIDDYIQIAHDNALNGRDALTYSAWIYPTSWDGSIRQIMAKSVHGGGSGRAQMGLFSEGGVLKGRAETNLGRVEITTKLPSLNQWSHVALVFSGTSISLIVDGSSEGISNFSSRQLLSTTDPLNISKRVGTSQYYFAGAIDEVRVYTSALSQSHIQSIMNERHTCETPPVADWRFDSSGWNGTVDEVHDSSGNEFHGVAFDTNTTAGKICNAADFSANSTSDYLSMNRDALNGRSDFTIATWYKSSNQGATALLSGSNASRLNETIFWLYRSTAFGPHLLNSSGSGLNMPEIADGNWHFIVWTRLSSSNCLYVDDIFYGCVGRKAGPLSIDVGGLILGQEQDRVGGGFDIDQEIEGLLDEMLIFNRGLSAAQVSDIWKNHNAGFTWDGLARSCTELGAAQFLIAHDGHGINCLLETGTITALDANKKVVTGYVGQIILDTQTGHGTWSLKNGNGVLTDATLDDGRASYQFVASDQGSVNFALSYMQGSTPFDIEVYQNDDVSVRDDDSEGHMEFSPNGFTITSNILSNPPPNPISDPVGTQTAGSVFEIHIAAFGQTDTDPICGVIESYAGDKSLSFWMDYLDPNSGALSSTVDGTLVSVTEGAATAQKIAFVAGQAAVSVKYKDVGAIRLHLKDVVSAPAEIRGGSNAFVVRPADLRITRVQSSSGAVNPASTTATGSGFVAAGSAFVVDVDARDSEGDLTPNFGKEAVPETLTLYSDSLLLPVAGRNMIANDGVLLNGGDFSASVTAGRYTNNSVAFDEVGIINMRARVTDDNYMGTGALLGSSSGNIGRFYPAEFIKTSDAVVAACGNFTYMQQAAMSLSYVVQARNVQGLRVQNYDASLLGASAVASMDYLAENADSGVNLGARLSALASSWVLGEYSLNTTSLSFARAASTDGPFETMQLGLKVVEPLDNVALSGLNMNPFTSGDCNVVGNCTGSKLGGSSALYYGRMMVLPGFGPETKNLDISLNTQMFNGLAFQLNTADSCTTYAIGATTLSNYQGNLESGESSAIAPVGAVTMLSGQDSLLAPLLLSAPGLGNEGQVDLTLDVSAWLEFDWFGAGDVDPLGQATFGRFRGHDNIIYWRETP